MRKFYFSVLVLGIGVVSGCASGVYYETKPELPEAARSRAITDLSTLTVCSRVNNVNENSEQYNRAMHVNIAQLEQYRFDVDLFDRDVNKYIQTELVPKLNSDKDYEKRVVNYCTQRYWGEMDRRYLEMERAAIAREREELQNRQQAENFMAGVNAFNNILNQQTQSMQQQMFMNQNMLNQLNQRSRPAFQMPQNQRTTCIEPTPNS